ncbi:hypothetical protein N2152v2_003946 [Parachlorella kessleri]
MAAVQAAENQCDERLGRLLGRRQLPLLHHTSSEEKEAAVPSRSVAAGALRQLLQGRTGDLAQLQQDFDVGSCLSPGLPAASKGGAAAAVAFGPTAAGAHPQNAASAASAAGLASAGEGFVRGSLKPPGCLTPVNGEMDVSLQQQQHSGGQGADQTASARPAASLPVSWSEQVSAPQSREEDGLGDVLRQEAAAEAERQRARAAREQQLLGMQLAYARHHMAAFRIAQAWRRYLPSSARARRAAAATAVQAFWRGRACRREAALQVERLGLLRQLRAAAEGGSQAGVQEAARALAQLGFAGDAHHLVTSFEDAAAQAAQQLRSAAAAGSSSDYLQALGAVQKYRHLQPALAEAAAAFGARAAAAEQALQQAVDEAPLFEFQEAVAAAAALGVAAYKLELAQQQVLERNRQAQLTLQSTVETAPFSPAAFQAACERAERLGLHAEVARAQRALQQRKQQAVQALHRLAEQGSAAQVEAAAEDARGLGGGDLEAAAAAAVRRLAERRAQAGRQLKKLVNQGTVAEFEAGVLLARDLGVEPAEQEACMERFARRGAALREQLDLSAAQGGLAEFRVGRAQALQLVPVEHIQGAERVFQERRQLAAGQLAAATRALCQLITHICNCCNAGEGACEAHGSGAVDGVAAVVGAFADLVRQLSLAVREAVAAEAAAAAAAAARPKTAVRPATANRSQASDSSAGGSRPGSKDSMSSSIVARASSVGSIGMDGVGGGLAIEPGTGSGALAPLRHLVEELCHGQPYTLQQHTLPAVDGQQPGGACSLREALLRLVSDSLAAGRLGLGDSAVGAAWAAAVTQAEVLLAQHAAVTVQVSSARLAQQPDQQRPSQQAGGDPCGQDIILRQVRPQLQLPHRSGSCSGGGDGWLAGRSLEALVHGYQAWREQQRSCLGAAALRQLEQEAFQPHRQTQEQGPALARASASAAGGSAQAQPSGGSRPSSRLCGAGEDVHLDVSRQGLASLELLAACTSLRSLDLGTNLLGSLDGLSALMGLQDLAVLENRLTSLSGLQGLSSLTRLVAHSNPLQDLSALSGLVSLRSLSLSSCGLSTLAPPACLAACTSLTSLDLAGNRLHDLAASLPALPRLLRLDVSRNQLASLAGLAARCPLLCTLLASGNRLASFPPDLHLPFLQELWLSDCGMAGVPRWPWLPSLRALRLQDNQLAALPPMHGFPALAHLDLSFNALPALPENGNVSGRSSGGGPLLFTSLAPLTALASLKLNDTPLAASAAYGSAVAQALPWLRELDLEPVEEGQRQQRLQRACRSGQHLPCMAALLSPAAPAPPPASPAGAAAAWLHQRAPLGTGSTLIGPGRERAVGMGPSIGSSMEEQAQWLRFLLFQGEVALEALGQQPALRQLLALEHSVPSSSLRPTADWGTLAALGVLPQQRMAGSLPADLAERLLSFQYAVLLAADPSSHATTQPLLTVNPAYYRAALARLSHAATAIQAAWRGHAARRLRLQLAAAHRQAQLHRAAAAIQAAWRGWEARRRHLYVTAHLGAWRAEWRAAQALLEAHRRHHAAARVQASWRGHQVRLRVAEARATARSKVQHALSAAAGLSDSLEAELGLGISTSLEDVLLGSLGDQRGALAAPERLSPSLAAGDGGLGRFLSLPADAQRGQHSARWSAASRQSAPAALAAPALRLAGPDSAASWSGSEAGSSYSGSGIWVTCSRPLSSLSAPALKLPPLSPGGGSSSSSSSLATMPGAGPAVAAARGPQGQQQHAAAQHQHLPPLSPGTSTVVDSLQGDAGDGSEQDWTFKDDATAKAFVQLQRKRAAQARRREVHKALKDPAARLEHLMRTTRKVNDGRERRAEPAGAPAAAAAVSGNATVCEGRAPSRAGVQRYGSSTTGGQHRDGGKGGAGGSKASRVEAASRVRLPMPAGCSLAGPQVHTLLF